MRECTLRLSGLLAFAFLLMGWNQIAWAAPPGPIAVEAPHKNFGYDISFPQCKRPLPSAPVGFIIIGVTEGSAFTTNDCLHAQVEWAQQNTNLRPALYLNLNGVMYKTWGYSLDGPKGKCGKADVFCQAYNYGYHTAQFAFDYATEQGAIADMWWLDVEWVNYWPYSTALNDVVIQSAIDFMSSKKVMVGIYSTQLQWRWIAGAKFVPKLPSNVHLPIWLATVADAASAPAYCSADNAFGGGMVWYVQFPGKELDENFDCFGSQSDSAPSP